MDGLDIGTMVIARITGLPPRYVRANIRDRGAFMYHIDVLDEFDVALDMAFVPFADAVPYTKNRWSDINWEQMAANGSLRRLDLFWATAEARGRNVSD